MTIWNRIELAFVSLVLTAALFVFGGGAAWWWMQQVQP